MTRRSAVAQIAPAWVLEHGVGWVRRDPDGTVWTAAADASRGGWSLAMRYRDHYLRSRHETLDAAQRHADDMTAMLAARSLRDYAAGAGR